MVRMATYRGTTVYIYIYIYMKRCPTRQENKIENPYCISME